MKFPLNITTSAAQEVFYHGGGAANFSFTKTFGGTTLTIDLNFDVAENPPNDDLWVPLQDGDGALSLTGDYANTTEPLAACWVRFTTTGGTGIDIEAMWKTVKFL